METEKAGFVAEIKEIAEQYIQDSILLAKLEASEKVAGIVWRLYILIPLALIIFLIVLVGSFLLGYYLSLWLGGFWAGYGIVLIIYIALFFFLIYLHKSKLKTTIANKVIQAFFENK